MTVASAVNRTVVSGNGSATTFAYTFPIISSSHLVVVRSTAAGVDTTLTLGTHYSVSGVGSASGGSITYPLSGSALPAGDRLIMLRSVPLTQLTDLSNQGAFYAEVHETTFDNLCMADQQLSERLDRAVVVPPSDTGSLVLPNAVTRAGKYLTFDGSGNATTSASAEITGSLMAMERTGNGITTVWTLPAVLAGGSRSVIVAIDGVVQPISSYDVTGDQLIFGVAPPLNAAVDVRVIGTAIAVSQGDTTVAGDLTVSGKATVAGRIGGGTASPSVGLHVQSTVSGTERTIRSGYDGTYYVDLRLIDSARADINAAQSALTLSTLDVAHVHVGTNGKVGIGTTTPANKVEVLSTATVASFVNTATGGSDYSQIAATCGSKTVTLGTRSQGAGDSISYILTTTAQPLTLWTNATERLRIDASGYIKPAALTNAVDDAAAAAASVPVGALYRNGSVVMFRVA